MKTIRHCSLFTIFLRMNFWQINPLSKKVNKEHYPAWDVYTKALKEKGIRNMIYINPYLVDVEGNFPNRRNLFKEAVEGNYFVMNSTGTYSF